MIKRKYLIIALATVSVLVGSVFYSSLVSGASSPSGSWGTIRFFEPNETYAHDYGVWIEAARFIWTPENSTNNAILSVYWYFKYKFDYDGGMRIICNGIALDSINFWAGAGGPVPWTQSSVSEYANPQPNNYLYGPPANSGGYTFVVEATATNAPFYVKNINVVITVVDGMRPNKYYKVELPSEGVGGFWIPVDKFSLVAPYIALVSTIILAVSISVAYIKYRKKQ